jgi:asparagine synthase (glutamine-hydrolysing)
MTRYVAFRWNPENAAAAGASSRFLSCMNAPDRWQSSFTGSGLVILQNTTEECETRAYTLFGNAGLIIGTLFRSESRVSDDEFDHKRTDDLLGSGGRNLLDRYWGHYIAFLHDVRHKRTIVIRDCSGAMRCYRLRLECVDILFSDINDLDVLPSCALTVNTSYLASFISYSQLQIRDCGLNEVTELLAGDAVTFQEDSVVQLSLWDPRRICELEPVENFESAAVALRTVTQACVDSWSSRFRSILLALSGGFDSTVVLASLVRARNAPAVTCVNYYSAHATDDERRYARLAAQHCSTRLIEVPRSSERTILNPGLLHEPKSAKPAVTSLFHLDERARISRLSTEYDAESMWTGEGGDHLFLAMRTHLSANDYRCNHALDLGLFSAVADAARLSRQPYVAVLRALAKGTPAKLPGSSSLPVELHREFLEKEAMLAGGLERNLNPWAASCEGLPPGKQYQIFYLADILNRDRGISGVNRGYQHHPLLSQPLIELCLRIPTYTLLKGGVQRSLARHAFECYAPKEIIGRMDKGESTPYVADVIREGESFVAELLLDGQLVRDGIIRRAALEPYLRRRKTFRGDQISPLLACVAAELWVRHWSRPGRAAVLR